MTIYTLLLYLFIAAIGLLLLLGYGHSKLRKDSVYHPTAWFIQYFLSALMLVSGLVKALDPLGTAYKMKDYFIEFGQQGLPFMDLMIKLALPFSLLTIIFELVVGLCLLFGVGGKKTLWANLGMMLFFTFLTGFNYLTGFTPKAMGEEAAVGLIEFSKWTAFSDNNIRITDCGCFGDFLKLKPVETFVKDIFFTILSIALLGMAFKVKELLPNKKAIRTGFVVFAIFISTLFCFMNFYFDEPMVDFRPFKEGTNLPKAIEECEANSGKVEMIFVYKNNTTGEVAQFDAKSLPDASQWTYQSRIDKVLEVGCDSKVKELKQFPEILHYQDFEELKASDGYSLLVVSSEPTKGNKEAFIKIASLAQQAAKLHIPTYGLYFNIDDANNDGSREDDLDKFRHDYQLPIDFRFGDEKLVLTISRANPGLLLIKDGVILKKYHHRHIPVDFASMKAGQ